MHNQEENGVAVTTVTSNKISKERGKTMKNEKTSLNIRKLKKQVKGITLIALVVTIIVLLILAGVALSLTVGDNGLFRRAENAANTWQMAEQNEQIEMEKASNFIEDYMNGNGGSGNNTQGGGSETGGETSTVADLKPSEGEEVTILDKTTEVKDGLENKVVIPGGFGIASDSGTNVEDGIVIEDEDGNQFVWIPAKTEAEGGAIINLSTGGTANVVYKRTDFGKQYGSYSDYSEAMPTDEIESVNANGGYYIGRYEAGDGSSTDFRNGATEGTVVIKKNQIPYNWITRANAESKARKMDTVQGYTTATTKLVSSYAWDTALDFIQKANSDNEHSDYATSSPEGSYSNTNYGGYGTTVLIRTGQTTAVSNIYDMGGNLWEFTTESYSGEYGPYVNRGGYYNNGYDDHPAGYRGNHTGSAGGYSTIIGFRPTLYCSTES